MRGAFLLPTALLGAVHAQTDVIGAPLATLATGSTRTGTNTVSGTLSLAVCTYTGPSVVQQTRCFNGGIPGPTFYLKAGDTWTLTINNQLPAEAHDTSGLHNFYRDFDKTNIHTHGLHISSAAPGDDIFTEVDAGTSYTYTYTIPADHMGGTFWYHPHHHGSTAIQAGGGAAGMIIVEDATDEVPSAISSLTSINLMMVHLNMPELTEISQEKQTDCQNQAGGSAANCAETVWAPGATSGTQTNFVHVNGQYQPTISLDANTWYRLRMVYAAVDSIIQPTVTGCGV